MDSIEIKLNRMYDDFAHLWPLISAPEDYANEAHHWREALRAKLGPGRHEILELGVGGGNNLSHLTGDFQATAVDLSAKMVEVSKKLNPGVEHHVGDMRKVRLGRTFKAVIIHDAISYLITADEIRATLETVKAHLEPGGVFITSPDYTRETFVDGAVHHSLRTDGMTQLAHVDYMYDPDPDDTTYECLITYIIRESGHVRIEHDRHILGLFPFETWVELIGQAGFTVEKRPYDVHDDHRESYLLVGVKR